MVMLCFPLRLELYVANVLERVYDDTVLPIGLGRRIANFLGWVYDDAMPPTLA